MTRYFLLNTVSKRRTKMARKAAPAPQKYNQRFCGGTIRLPRGKHFPITEEQLLKHADELEAKQNAGAVEVRVGSPMGPVHDFATLEDVPEAAAPEEAASEETVDAQPEPEGQDDATEAPPAEEVEDSEAGEAEEAQDFGSMTNKELVALILEHSDDWDEKELKKMKKADLLELLG